MGKKMKKIMVLEGYWENDFFPFFVSIQNRNFPGIWGEGAKGLLVNKKMLVIQ